MDTFSTQDDAAGQLLCRVALGWVTEFGYDGAGRRVCESGPSGWREAQARPREEPREYVAAGPVLGVPTGVGLSADGGLELAGRLLNHPLRQFLNPNLISYEYPALRRAAEESPNCKQMM